MKLWAGYRNMGQLDRVPSVLREARALDLLKLTRRYAREMATALEHLPGRSLLIGRRRALLLCELMELRLGRSLTAPERREIMTNNIGEVR